MKILNVVGQEIYSSAVETSVNGNGRYQLDISLKAGTGIYFIQIITDKEIISKKVIVRK